jgi:RNA polymerase sigma-70 factor (ECF subfamily)
VQHGPGPPVALPFETPDEAVVSAILEGDVEAYRILVRRYEGALGRYASRMTPDPDVAMDLVQRTLIRGFERLRQCRDPSRVRHWLLAILANECRHHARRLRKHLSLDHEGAAAVPATASSAARAEREELRDLLSRALDALSFEQREAFVLRHVEELSYQQMTILTGASVAALKQRVHRAREVMSELLMEAR